MDLSILLTALGLIVGVIIGLWQIYLAQKQLRQDESKKRHQALRPAPVTTEQKDLLKPFESGARSDAYIFISYARSDQTVAQQVEKYLTNRGFRVFRDTEDIFSGVNWDMTIEKALQETTHMILLLSASSMPYRKEVHREWFYYDQKGKPLYLLYIEKCELHSRLYAYQYIEAREDLSSALESMVECIQQPFNPVGELHPRDRIVISNEADERSLSELFHDLLATIRNEKGSIALSPTQVEQLIKYRPKDLTEYRLTRIAEWSQPRFQLYNRFVQLTMLIDQGDDALGTRWREVKRYNDLREVVEEVTEPVIVLLGSPGSGKSTLLRHLQLEDSIDRLRDGKPRLTFFIQLNQYRASGESTPLLSPRQWLSQHWHERYPDLPAFDKLLQDGHMLLLLDALNEMPYGNATNYGELVSTWRHFLRETIYDNPGNRVIFSCRTLDYSAPLSTPALRVPQIRLESMDDAQIQKYLTVYMPGRAKAIWQELKDSAQLSLFRTPYFLKLLVEQIADEQRIPQGRAELFTEFVRRALRRETERGNPLFQHSILLTDRDHRQITQAKWTSPYDLPERGLLIPKVTQLAFQMQISNITTEASQIRINIDDAYKILDHERADDILRAGVALNLLEENPAQDEILFFHQLIQEFFAARHFAINPDYERVRVEWRADRVTPSLEEKLTELINSEPLPPLPSTGWEETTIFAAAMTGDADTFVHNLMDTNLPLAGRCAATSDVRLSQALRGKIKQALIVRTQDLDADLRSRIIAGLVLGRVGDPRFERKTGKHGDYLMPPMVDIPAGTYIIGDDSSDFDSEKPEHVVTMKSFQIGKFPVTNAEYALFIKAGGYENEQWWETESAKAWRGGENNVEGPKQDWREQRSIRQSRFDRIRPLVATEKPSHQKDDWEDITQISEEAFEALLDRWYPAGQQTQPSFWNSLAHNNPDQPVVGICWYEALAYCAWLSAQTGLRFRLPTEVEWEAAARGLGGRRFPFGNEFDSSRCNTFESHIRRATPIGIFPNGATPEGCVDLCGNIPTWTSSVYAPYPYNAEDGRENSNSDERRIVKGIPFSFTGSTAPASWRHWLHPANRYYDFGFRLCCASPIPNRG